MAGGETHKVVTEEITEGKHLHVLLQLGSTDVAGPFVSVFESTIK